MFCIAAFIILLFMGAVSAKYRRYLAQAWDCTLRRVTFRPCDTSFKQDIKDRMLAPLATRSPQLVRPAAVALEVVAVFLVLLTVWSGYEVVKSGLNLLVYGTCNKQNSESCSLGAEACSIGAITPSFLDSLREGDVIGAFGNEFSSLGETISAIPSRLQSWEAEDYLPENVTYLREYSADKPTAVEAIDPGCVFCRQLFANITEAGFDDRYNLAYIAAPIASDGVYKFPNSLLVTQYLEALRLHPLDGAETPVDWQVLERIYTGVNEKGTSYQSVINGREAPVVVELLYGWLSEFGLTAEHISVVASAAESPEVAQIIAANQALVQEKIHTVKIPTLIFDGRRHDGLVSVENLR
ncbi:MAG TPA: hypothetical protein VGP24_16500 [Glaciihabitans sp.]|jgi:hypothetical protein|nr:hypothetical protein [Glaciihabitans sp.]